jgi:hypothetical protein
MLVGNYSGGLGLFFGKPDKIFGVGGQIATDFPKLTISPNPAQSEIAISLNTQSSYKSNYVIIKGMDQKVVKYCSNANFPVTIDVSGFANGIYLVSALTDKGMANGKLVICR